MDRNETIAKIKAALKRRSGKSWSVTGGKGTAWGWITIDTPPARRTWGWRLPHGFPDIPGNWEEYDTGRPGGYIIPDERRELADLLGFEKPVHHQGESIPASGDYWQEYIDRAEGRTPTKMGVQYWD
jgi:hypothetical protein